MSAFTPTTEQAEARAAFHAQADSGGALVIEAGAGTGKTSTLALIAESTPRRGQYMAFNKAIVVDAGGRFPDTVQANTAHSLAFRAVGHAYKARMDGARRIRNEDIARALRIDPIDLPTGVGNEKRRMAPGWLAGQVMRAIDRFCSSADLVPGGQHVPYVDGLDLPEPTPPTEPGGPPGTRRGWANNRELRRYLEPFIVRGWMDLCQTRGFLRFGHSHYLKLWQLSEPRIGADYILFDEAQDANPVMAAVVERQDHAQRVYVGDGAQCQPAGTLVTVQVGRGGTRGRPTAYRHVPIEQIQPGDRVLSFSVPHSFLRRTGSTVNRIASRPYDGPLVEVEADGFRSSYTPNHRCVVRVGDALVDRWVVYLMRRGQSFRVGMVQGVYHSQSGDLGLPRRLATERGDAAWILSTHATEGEARVAEMLTAWTYNIPSLRFRQGLAHGITQAQLDDFWSKVGDLTDEAIQCLRAHHRLIEFPFCEPGRRVYRNRAQTMEACNLIDGMLVLSIDGAFAARAKQVAKNRWSPMTTRQAWYRGPVYSLAVEGDETYVADGIVTHNSIYEWTGAIDAMSRMAALDGTRVAYLSQSFRFGPAIAEVANGLLSKLGTPLRLVGLESIASTVATDEPLERPHAVLCRTNATAVQKVLLEQSAGRRAALVGDGKEVLDFAEGAEQLMSNGHTSHRELSCFSSWASVQAYVAADPLGHELRLLVNLVDEFGCAVIRQALSRLPREADAEIVVSTAHKAKGREWPTVALAGDFPVPKPGTREAEEETPGAETRLLYVAVTRARHALDVSACPLLFKAIGAKT